MQNSALVLQNLVLQTWPLWDPFPLLLKVLLSGHGSALKVSQLHDRVFSFNVSCKEVRFFILHQRSFVCPQFKCFFHLWGHGGPDWVKEFRLWQAECDQEWTLISPSKRRARLGLEAMQHVPGKSSLHCQSARSFQAYSICHVHAIPG